MAKGDLTIIIEAFDQRRNDKQKVTYAKEFLAYAIDQINNNILTEVDYNYFKKKYDEIYPNRTSLAPSSSTYNNKEQAITLAHELLYCLKYHYRLCQYFKRTTDKDLQKSIKTLQTKINYVLRFLFNDKKTEKQKQIRLEKFYNASASPLTVKRLNEKLSLLRYARAHCSYALKNSNHEQYSIVSSSILSEITTAINNKKIKVDELTTLLNTIIGKFKDRSSEELDTIIRNLEDTSNNTITPKLALANLQSNTDLMRALLRIRVILAPMLPNTVKNGAAAKATSPMLPDCLAETIEENSQQITAIIGIVSKQLFDIKRSWWKFWVAGNKARELLTGFPEDGEQAEATPLKWSDYVLPVIASYPQLKKYHFATRSTYKNYINSIVNIFINKVLNESDLSQLVLVFHALHKIPDMEELTARLGRKILFHFKKGHLTGESKIHFIYTLQSMEKRQGRVLPIVKDLISEITKFQDCNATVKADGTQIRITNIIENHNAFIKKRAKSLAGFLGFRSKEKEQLIPELKHIQTTINNNDALAALKEDENLSQTQSKTSRTYEKIEEQVKFILDDYKYSATGSSSSSFDEQMQALRIDIDNLEAKIPNLSEIDCNKLKTLIHAHSITIDIKTLEQKISQLNNKSLDQLYIKLCKRLSIQLEAARVAKSGDVSVSSKFGKLNKYFTIAGMITPVGAPIISATSNIVSMCGQYLTQQSCDTLAELTMTGTEVGLFAKLLTLRLILRCNKMFAQVASGSIEELSNQLFERTKAVLLELAAPPSPNQSLSYTIENYYLPEILKPNTSTWKKNPFTKKIELLNGEFKTLNQLLITKHVKTTLTADLKPGIGVITPGLAAVDQQVRLLSELVRTQQQTSLAHAKERGFLLTQLMALQEWQGEASDSIQAMQAQIQSILSEQVLSTSATDHTPTTPTKNPTATTPVLKKMTSSIGTPYKRVSRRKKSSVTPKVKKALFDDTEMDKKGKRKATADKPHSSKGPPHVLVLRGILKAEKNFCTLILALCTQITKIKQNLPPGKDTKKFLKCIEHYKAWAETSFSSSNAYSWPEDTEQSEIIEFNNLLNVPLTITNKNFNNIVENLHRNFIGKPILESRTIDVLFITLHLGFIQKYVKNNLEIILKDAPKNGTDLQNNIYSLISAPPARSANYIPSFTTLQKKLSQNLTTTNNNEINIKIEEIIYAWKLLAATLDGSIAFRTTLENPKYTSETYLKKFIACGHLFFDARTKGKQPRTTIPIPDTKQSEEPNGNNINEYLFCPST